MTRSLETIIDDFAFLDDWEDKYRYVIELGGELEPLSQEDRSDANKVKGCVSQVWLSTSIGPGGDPTIRYVGDSDAHIVRGLVAIMITALSGRTASEISKFDVEALLTSLGLDEHLSPQRSNGLRSMIDRMKRDAAHAEVG